MRLFGMAAAYLVAAAAAEAGHATREECVAKAREAAQLVLDRGTAAAIAALSQKDGPFVWKDTYVFLMDLDGTMLAHPTSPELIGKNLLDVKDKGGEGKLLFKEFVTVARTTGEGWVDYLWPKPGAQARSRKVSYIYRVPGKDLLVGAGVYE